MQKIAESRISHWTQVFCRDAAHWFHIVLQSMAHWPWGTIAAFTAAGAALWVTGAQTRERQLLLAPAKCRRTRWYLFQLEHPGGCHSWEPSEEFWRVRARRHRSTTRPSTGLRKPARR
jgi:hypothetical protein